MLANSKGFKNFLMNFIVLIFCGHTYANPVWHCSRNNVQIADASDNFTLAALTIEREVISLSLRDLYTAFHDSPVKMNGNIVLSACIIGNKSELTMLAMNSIGEKSALINSINTQSKFRHSHIHVVNDESAMLSCISKNHPAVGFLSIATKREDVGPCF